MRPPPRKLAVLASLDVAGFTRLVEEDERATLSELANIRRKIIRPTLATYSGNLFKTMGDGALIEFPNVEDSVRWGIAFQTKMAQRNDQRPDEEILIRLGIGLADVFVQGEDRFGAAVGFVVRLQQAAPPGGIAITHSVRWQLVKALAAEFDRTQWVEFKNMDEQYEIWLWRRPWDPVSDEGMVGIGHRPLGSEDEPPVPAAEAEAEPVIQGAPSIVPPDRPSIVVLPFDNMSGNPADDSLIDGLVEEITATLSRVRDFTVIARNSAYAYKGRAVDVREIAKELGVRYVLEGSARKAGERVRITAQLIDASSGAHIWADRYDGIVENLFDFEDEISTRVAGALRPSIWDAEIAAARRKRPENLAAYDLVLRALPHLWAHKQEDNAEAIRLLDEAMALDPNYARAMAIAAWARAQHVVYNWTKDIEAVRAEADVLIGRASPAVGDDPTALTALSTATMLLFGDLDRSRVFVERALALDPNNAWAWTRHGFLQAYRGMPEQALESFNKAVELSPLDPFSFNGYIGLGFANFAAGRPEEAIKWAKRALGEKVGMTWAYRDLAVYNAHLGNLEEARECLARFTAARPDLTLAEVDDAMKFMEADTRRRYVEGLRLAGLPEDRPVS